MKRLLSLILALLMLTSISAVAFADVSNEAENTDATTVSSESGEPTRAEETEWCFRVYHGIRQMRLWSITYRKWLTDWIDIGPAN